MPEHSTPGVVGRGTYEIICGLSYTKDLSIISVIVLILLIKPLGMQASIFGACPEPGKVGGLWQEGHPA